MIGMTYSTADYDLWTMTKDKNIFEEVVDKIILENSSNIDEKRKNAIFSSTNKKDKRMAILSLLDKDRNLFLKIKGLVNEEINRMEHIKDVILMLREYVKVGEVEKKKYGEVMTPLELVKEMLNTLPEKVWSNPNLKWLDPANGTGPYPVMVIYKLMNGLKDWEPDDEKRYKHIVENMIYVCELQPKNMFLYMCAVDPFDKYKLNVYTGSFLDESFDKHMKDVWQVDKFDIGLGNPPYQLENTSEKSKTTSNVKLWRIFIEKSIININNDGYLIFVTPSSWASGTKNPHNSTNLFNDIFKKLNTLYVSFDVNKFFRNIGVDFTYYLIQNCEYKGKTTFDDGYELDISILDLLPKKLNSTIFSIIKKIEKVEKMNFIMDRKDHYKGDLIDFQDENYKYKVYCGSGKGILFSDKFSPFMNKRKIFTHRISTLKMISDNIGEISTNYSQVLIISDNEDAEYAKSLFSTKFYLFLYDLFKYTQYNEKINLNQLPKVSLNRHWTDEQLFEYFELTQEERDIILNYDKK